MEVENIGVICTPMEIGLMEVIQSHVLIWSVNYHKVSMNMNHGP